MPIHIDDLDVQVDVDAPASAPAGTAASPADAEARWLEHARHQAELAARLAAWNFDD